MAHTHADDQPALPPPVSCAYRDEESRSCFGHRAAGFDYCLAHLRPDQRDQALQRLHPGADLDASGTPINAALLGRILQAVQDDDGRPTFGRVEFYNARFTEDASFTGVVFTKRAGFIGAQFTGDARFDGAKFTGDASFGVAQFTKEAAFGGAQFTGDAKFDGARFTGDARFGSAQFTGDAKFDGARFRGYAWFNEVKFAGEASFDGTEFFRDITEFDDPDEVDHEELRLGDAMFDDAQFENVTSLGPLAAGSLRLDRAVFGRPVLIRAAAQTVSCCDVTWTAGVELRLRYAVVILTRARFTVSSFVTGFDQPFLLLSGDEPYRLDEQQVCARVRGGDYIPGDPNILWAPRSLDQWMPRLISLWGSDAPNLSLTDVDLSRCQFAGTQLLDQLRLEGRCIFDHPPRGMKIGVARPDFWSRRRIRAWRRSIARSPGRAQPPPPLSMRTWLRFMRSWLRRSCADMLTNGAHLWSTRQSIAEERSWRATTRNYAGWSKKRSGQAEVGPERLAVLYRQLRKAQEDAKNEPGAADFYYGEMEMRRNASTTSAGERGILWLYWLISGYGLRAIRALAALLVLSMIVTTLLVGWGLAAAAPPQQLTGTITSRTGKLTRIDATLTTATPQLPPATQRWTGQRTATALQVTVDSIVFRSTAQPLQRLNGQHLRLFTVAGVRG